MKGGRGGEGRGGEEREGEERGGEERGGEAQTCRICLPQSPVRLLVFRLVGTRTPEPCTMDCCDILIGPRG